MGTIVTRKSQTGQTTYRVQIRKRLPDGSNYSESRTFSTRTAAKDWERQRESELKANPALMQPQAKTGPEPELTVGEALERYAKECEGKYGRTKLTTLRMLKAWPIAARPLTALTRVDFAEHTCLRRIGMPDQGFNPASPATIGNDLVHFSSLFHHADGVWGIDMTHVLTEYARGRKALSKARAVSKSGTRQRLPTSSELQALTTYFYRAWLSDVRVRVPMHLVIWLAIYTGRRQAELVRIPHDNPGYVRDVKNPRGSKGNHRQSVVPEAAQAVIAALDETRPQMLRGRGPSDLLLPVSGNMICRYFTEACRVLGIEDLHFHDLRHEAATRLAEDGLTIPQIQSVTLHDSWGTLKRYVDLKPRGSRLDFQRAIDAARLAVS